MNLRSYQIVWMLIFGVSISAQNAPVSTVNTFTSAGNSALIEVTSSGFSNIGSCNLQLLYDPSVLICTSVEKGDLLPGNLASNISVPGVITLGWYTWPGVMLPDNSVVFELVFSKLTGNSSQILWNNDYPDRQWSDGNFAILNDLPVEDFYFPGTLNFQENAPITIAPVINVCSVVSEDVPIKVTNFNDIGAVSLTMHYNSSALVFQSFTNNSGFPGLMVFNPAPGIITAAGFSTTSGITLPDNSVFFTLHFNFTGGSSGLEWFDDGVSCEYTGPPPNYLVLNDIPQESYYVDGSYNEISVPPAAGVIFGPAGGNVCKGQSGVIFSVAPITYASEYNWSLPAGASITGGFNSPVITVTFDETAAGGPVTVYGSNTCGSGGVSPGFLVAVNSAPDIIQQPVSPDTVVAGAGTASFTVSATGFQLSYHWQEYVASWFSITDGGVYSGALSETLIITNPPVEMNGNRYRCVIEGFCEPPDTTDGIATLTVVNYAGTKKVSNPVQLNPYIFLNPSTKELYCFYELSQKGNASLELIGLHGDMVMKSDAGLQLPGNNTVRFNAGFLNPGLYLIRIKVVSEECFFMGTVKFASPGIQ